jgi:hypothetical protein
VSERAGQWCGSSIGHPHAGAAGDRRRDRGVAKLYPGVVDLRLIVLHRRGVLRDQRDLRVTLLHADRILRDQLLVALQIELGIGEQGLVERLGGDDLVELCLKRTGVDLGKKIACLHVLTLDEDHFVQGSVDASTDGHGVVGLNRAKTGKVNWHIACLRHRGSRRRRGFEQFPQQHPQADSGQADQGATQRMYNDDGHAPATGVKLQ